MPFFAHLQKKAYLYPEIIDDDIETSTEDILTLLINEPFN